jgi:3-oxoacyl-[acyl-carrier protein] reductase
MELADLKIIVTGAASGMGAYFTRQLVQAGAQVAAGDLNAAGLTHLAEDTADLPGALFTHSLDAAQEEDTASFVDWAHAAMGGLNGLLNNAGILRDGLLVKKDRASGEITTMSRAQWQQVIDVNLTGATWMVRDAVAKMAADEVDTGVVINMSSLSRYGNRGQSNYVAAKAALAANTVTWAREFAPFHIRVGALAPGLIDTPMTQGMHQQARENLIKAIPVGRIGQPHDIWLGVKFIIENDYFTGRCIDIDGGLHML